MPEDSAVAETLVQIRIKLAELGEKLDQFKDMPERLRNIETKTASLDQRESVSENRIKDLEAANSWLWRTIGAAVITGIIGAVIAVVIATGRG